MAQDSLTLSFSEYLTAYSNQTSKRQPSYLDAYNDINTLGQPTKKQKLENSRPFEGFQGLAERLFWNYNNLQTLNKFNYVPSMLPLDPLHFPPESQPLSSPQFQRNYSCPQRSAQASQVSISSPKSKVMIKLGSPRLQRLEKLDLWASEESEFGLQREDSIQYVDLIGNNIRFKINEMDILNDLDGYVNGGHLQRRNEKSHLQKRLELMVKNNHPNLMNKLNRKMKEVLRPENETSEANTETNHQERLEKQLREMLERTQSLLEETKEVVNKRSAKRKNEELVIIDENESKESAPVVKIEPLTEEECKSDVVNKERA